MLAGNPLAGNQAHSDVEVQSPVKANIHLTNQKNESDKCFSNLKPVESLVIVWQGRLPEAFRTVGVVALLDEEAGWQVVLILRGRGYNDPQQVRYSNPS